jgi:hypothetical protein
MVLPGKDRRDLEGFTPSKHGNIGQDEPREASDSLPLSRRADASLAWMA